MPLSEVIQRVFVSEHYETRTIWGSEHEASKYSDGALDHTTLVKPQIVMMEQHFHQNVNDKVTEFFFSLKISAVVGLDKVC